MIKIKTFLLTMACVLISGFVFSQVPQTFSYQTVVRGDNGLLVCQRMVDVQVSILRDSESGESVYDEMHHLSTNINGLVTIEIGTGETDQDFSEIEWAFGPYFIKTQISLEGSTNQSIVNVAPMRSVPYAFYALSAGNADGSDVTLGTVLANGNDANGLQIKNVANPTDAQDAATKAYIDSLARIFRMAHASHEYVDLGLPNHVLWAKTNIGALTPEEYGDYFAWGETSPKDEYTLDTYVWGTGVDMTKYNETDGLTELEAADDAAAANWGAEWRMPTQAEIQELIDNCTWTWTTENGVNGYKVVGPNGNSIFFPAAGNRYGSEPATGGAFGGYWSSSLYADGPLDAFGLDFDSDNKEERYMDRYNGLPIRPVRDDNSTSQTFIDERDGTIYRTITIGEQTWMAENLKYLPSVVGPATGSETEPYYYVYGYNGTEVAAAKATENFATYGVLYNWPAAMAGASSSEANPSGVQGICPAGWHLPSSAEWEQLNNAISGDNVASQLAGNADLWESGDLTNAAEFGASGFNALPGGDRSDGGTFSYRGFGASFWTSTGEASSAYFYSIDYSFTVAEPTNEYSTNAYGNSVRCVRGSVENGRTFVDLGLPSGLKWANVNIGATNPEDFGNYYAWGETIVKDEYTEDNHTFTDGPATLGSGADAATVNWGIEWRMPTYDEFQELIDECTWELTELNGVSGYRVTSNVNSNSIFLPYAGVHYQTDYEGTGSYGFYWTSSYVESSVGYSWFLFLGSENFALNNYQYRNYTGLPIRPVSSGNSTFIDDRDGTTYRTVTIGEQVWMAENLKYLPSVVGPETGSSTEPYYYVYDYEGTDIEEAKATGYYAIYGVLYNWPAAMNGESSSEDNPSGVQGVCPSGWHLPSQDEWQQLDNALSGYNNGSQLAGNADLWESGDLINAAEFGTSGFNALPGGSRDNNSGGFFRYMGEDAVFWSATENNGNASDPGVNFYYTDFTFYDDVLELGFSVRCVRD